MRLSSGLVNINGRIHIRKTINGRRIQKSTGIPYRREFYAAANKALREIEATAYTGTREPKTCSEGAVRYLGGCKEKSLKRAASGLDNILTFRLKDGRLVGELYLHEIRYWMLEQFIESTKERWAKGVATDIRHFKRMLIQASTIWHDGDGETWIDSAPVLPIPSGAAKKPHILSRTDERAFIPLLSTLLQPMALFGLFTGCRTSEIERLKWTHYRDGYFSLPAEMTKMYRERPIVLNPSAKRIVENQRGNGEYVFACRHLHTRGWTRAWEAAGLPMDKDVMKGPHNLRHTFAFRLRDAGVPEWTVKDALGHKSGDVTRLYAKPSLEALLEAVSAPYLVGNWCDRPSRPITA